MPKNKLALKLTSNGCVVALAIPWLNLLVRLAPLFTCGPAPSTLCRTLKALASALPATPPSQAISAWTRSSLFWTRTSPTHQQTTASWERLIHRSRGVMSLLNISFTSTVQSLGRWCSGTAAGAQDPLAHLPQDRVLNTCMHKSDNIKRSSFIKWKTEHIPRMGTSKGMWHVNTEACQHLQSQSHVHTATHNKAIRKHRSSVTASLGRRQTTFDTHLIHINEACGEKNAKLERGGGAAATKLADTHLLLQEPFCQWRNCPQHMTAATRGG